VVGSQLLVVVVLVAVDWTEAELGINFESGCGPEGISGLFNSSVDAVGNGSSSARSLHPSLSRSERPTNSYSAPSAKA
jgi:hypothetical protein